MSKCGVSWWRSVKIRQQQAVNMLETGDWREWGARWWRSVDTWYNMIHVTRRPLWACKLHIGKLCGNFIDIWAKNWRIWTIKIKTLGLGDKHPNFRQVETTNLGDRSRLAMIIKSKGVKMKTTYLELDLVRVAPEHGPGHEHLVHLPVQRGGVVAGPDGVDGGARRQGVQELEAAEVGRQRGDVDAGPGPGHQHQQQQQQRGVRGHAQAQARVSLSHVTPSHSEQSGQLCSYLSPHSSSPTLHSRRCGQSHWHDTHWAGSIKV